VWVGEQELGPAIPGYTSTPSSSAWAASQRTSSLRLMTKLPWLEEGEGRGREREGESRKRNLSQVTGTRRGAGGAAIGEELGQRAGLEDVPRKDV